MVASDNVKQPDGVNQGIVLQQIKQIRQGASSSCSDWVKLNPNGSFAGEWVGFILRTD